MLIGLVSFYLVTFPLRLDPEILNVSQIVEGNRCFFLLDQVNETVWKTDLNGIILAKYAKKGQGPAEFIKISKLSCDSSQLYLSDWAKRSLLVFSQDFEFRKEFKFEGMVRDILIVDRSYFVLNWMNGHLIQKYDPELKLLTAFGTGLSDPRMLGSQFGHMILLDGRILLQHVFLPFFELFDLNGNLERRVNIPGFPESPLIVFETFYDRSKPNLFQVHNVYVSGTSLFFHIYDYSEGSKKRRDWLYQYNLLGHSFEERTQIDRQLADSLLSDHKGKTYRIFENEEGELSHLNLIDLKGVFND